MPKRIDELIAEELGCNEVEVTPNANIMIDLGADSLDVIELMMRLEEELDIKIPDDDIDDLETVKDIHAYVDKAKAKK